MRLSPKLRRQATAFAALAAIVPALAACKTAGDATGSIYPAEHRERHPITLADSPRYLDVFVQGASGIDGRQRQDVAAFLAEHRRYGSGPIVVQVPSGVADAVGTRRALDTIRGAGARMSVSGYQPNDPAVAAPIRLTFRRLQAQVAGKCGLWPDDLGTSDFASNIENRQYWNFGCAHQANLASQVADPVDLVRGRQETAPDTIRRMQNFDKIRQGQDPSTTYKQPDITVKQGVSQ